jgi:hypothetical protein
MTRFEKLEQSADLFFGVSKERMSIPIDSKQNIQFFCLKEMDHLVSCYFFLRFSPKAPKVSHHKKSCSGKVVTSCMGSTRPCIPENFKRKNVSLWDHLYTHTSHRDMQGKRFMEFMSHLSGYNMTARWKAADTRPEGGKELLSGDI